MASPALWEDDSALAFGVKQTCDSKTGSLVYINQALISLVNTSQLPYLGILLRLWQGQTTAVSEPGHLVGLTDVSDYGSTWISILLCSWA